MMFVAFIALAMNICWSRVAATQFAVYMSLSNSVARSGLRRSPRSPDRLDASEQFRAHLRVDDRRGGRVELLRRRLHSAVCRNWTLDRNRSVMISSVKLSVLDQSPIRSGGTAAKRARGHRARADHRTSRYHRFWVAEHHGSASFAGSSPEVLISTIAANPSRIPSDPAV
jgi:hypothetical protein